MTSQQNIKSKEIRSRLVSLGLNPDVVDLEWIAGIETDVQAAIDAFRNDPEFASAEPLFQPERSQ